MTDAIETEAPSATESDETTSDEVTTPESEIEAVEDESELDARTIEFSKADLAKLRKQSATYRERAKEAEERANAYAQRLHTALVAATGRLADPTDLEYSEEHLADEEALSAAIEGLIESKPHLKARKVSGDVGQGDRGKSEEPFSLLNALKRL